MKRSQFLTLAGVVPLLFGLVMLVAPDVMLDNSLVVEADAATRTVTRWVGFGVVSIGAITFLARNDPGSAALRAVMIGNILFHTLGIAIDVLDYAGGATQSSGLISGVVPHALLAAGFVYYLTRMRASVLP